MDNLANLGFVCFAFKLQYFQNTAQEWSLVVRPKKNASLYKRQVPPSVSPHRAHYHYKPARYYPAKNVHGEFRIEEHWFDLVARKHDAHRREAVEDDIEFQLLLCYMTCKTHKHS